MYQHPVLTESLVRDHVAELQRDGQRGRGARLGRRSHPVSRARKSTGWFLIHVGLRLAIPRRTAARSRMVVTSA